MGTPVQCSSCNQPFECENTPGRLLANCPHCGKENINTNVRGRTQHLKLIHDAPALVGVAFCLKCKKRISADSQVCIHCGFNQVTRKPTKTSPGLALRGVRNAVAGAVVLLAAAYALYRWLPAPRLEVADPAPAPPPAPASSAAAPAPGDPAPPAAADESSFEAKRAAAAAVFRQKLDEQAPLYRTNDTVELRLKTGQIVNGTLRRYAGTGPERTAILFTETGERRVVVREVDRNTRIRVDANYRENFIRSKLNLPAIPAVASTNGPQAGSGGGR